MPPRGVPAVTTVWQSQHERDDFIRAHGALPFDHLWRLLEDPFSGLWDLVFDGGDDHLVRDIFRYRRAQVLKVLENDGRR